MRVLLCSDIHGNAHALAAVLNEPVDHVLCAGDLVHFGPHPATCIELVRGRAVAIVRGNHDDGAGSGDDCHAYGPWRILDESSRSATDTVLSAADRQYLQALPLTKTVTLGGVRFTVVHASPADPLYRYLPPETPASVWKAELSLVATDVLVLGHTHLPLCHREEGVLIVNPGSVGLPRDGDPRAAFAIWEDGWVTFHRRVYDHRPLMQAIADLPLPGPAIADLVALFEGRGCEHRQSD